MSRTLKVLVGLCIVLAAAASGVGCGGSDVADACETICSKNAECQSDSPKESCLAVCKEQSKDEAYGDAIVEQADCYETASCEEVSFGQCVPQEV